MLLLPIHAAKSPWQKTTRRCKIREMSLWDRDIGLEFQMSGHAAPPPGQHQQADQQAAQRAQEYQKQLADQQRIEEQRRAEQRQRELDAEARRRAEQTNQR